MDKKLITKYEKNQQAIAKLNGEIEKAVGAQVARKAELEAQNKAMADAMLEAMEANDVDKFDGDLLTITRVKATTVTTFDSKRFMAERPKTAEKYMRTGDKKAYVRIKLKA